MSYEKEQLKLFTYRKEDIADLLLSLEKMTTSGQDTKKKRQMLINEQAKVENELTELEKKYGEFKIRRIIKVQTPEVIKESSEVVIPDYSSIEEKKEEELEIP